MSNLIDFINSNLSLDNYFLTAIELGIIWVVVYDFYHLLFNSILSWFTKK